ncbi:strictosidine synthase-like [Cornus florida]|uniref:strictosidine synthase-like n=1 Tax=Cornus florida TaxID=4283 RepID=UPI00289E8F44|nr:strictosidine synthase-like [Cornus florida]
MAVILSFKAVAMLSIFILVICLPFSMGLFYPAFNKLQLPSTSIGPVSSAFDLFGGGPYVGISDGRIVKYQGPPTNTFIDYAFDTPNRSKAVCDGTSNPDMGPLCGRPLGLGFNYRTGELYITDAYYGLMVAGTNGRLATQLATSAEGVPFRFLTGLDIDPTGIVYFADANTVYSLREIQQAIQSGDATGRLMKYDPNTKQVTVLLRGLAFATGVAVGRNGGFVLVSEFKGNRIQKYWLKGPKANTAEILLNLPGPGIIKRTTSGDFWVAANVLQQQPAQTAVRTGQRINEFGNVVQNVTLDAQYGNDLITEVQERLGTLYIGSLIKNFVGVLSPV